MLAAARLVFQRDGLAAQMDAIAAEAGLGVGTLYRHFPTREALIAYLAGLATPDTRKEFRQVVREAKAALNSMFGTFADRYAEAAAAAPDLPPDQQVYIRQFRGMTRDSDNASARRSRRGDAGGRIFINDAIRRVGSQQRGGAKLRGSDRGTIHCEVCTRARRQLEGRRPHVHGRAEADHGRRRRHRRPRSPSDHGAGRGRTAAAEWCRRCCWGRNAGY